MSASRPAAVVRTGGRARADWLVPVGLLAVVEFAADNAGFPWALTGAVMTLSLVLRRRYPLGIWAFTSVAAALLLARLIQLGPYESWSGSALVVLPAPLVALYTLTATSGLRGRLAFGGSVAGFMVLMYVLARGNRPNINSSGLAGLYVSPTLITLVGLGMLATAWALGETARTRRDSADARLAAEAAEKAEHDRAVAAEERARIARELHDITAHHISVVTLQAGTARMLAESGQQPSTELLRGIENASRRAMTEIRQALGVIRSTPDGAAPLPGLARLPELVAQMRLGGLTVEVTGEAGDLPGGLDLTAYRVVQEGLTNVVRHSMACAAQVTFWRGSEMLQITVTDHGPPRARPAAGSGGHGLIGLRERVAGYDGRLLAGPRAGGGFGLRAMLPLHDAVSDLPPRYLAAEPAEPDGDAPALPAAAPGSPALAAGR
jgi:signal transduction histidine kinase